MGSLDCVCKIGIISLDIKMTMVNNGVTQEVPTVRSQVSADIIAVADLSLVTLHALLQTILSFSRNILQILTDEGDKILAFIATRDDNNKYQ